MDRELIQAIETNGVVVYEKLFTLSGNLQLILTALLQVDAGQATAEVVEEAIAQVKQSQADIRTLGLTVLKGMPSYDLLGNIADFTSGLPEFKKVSSSLDYYELSYVGNPDEGLPGTVRIGYQEY